MKSKTLLIIGILINIFIWTNSLMPSNLSSSQSGLIVNLIYPVFKNVFDVNTFTTVVRKLAHFTEFMFLAIIFSYYFKSINIKNPYLITMIYGLIVAIIIDETIQTFIPGRAGLIIDVLIDFSGVITGVLVVFIISKIRLKHINNN